MSRTTTARWLGLTAAAALALAACAPGTGSDDETTEPEPTDTASETAEPTETGEEPITLTVWDQEVRGGQNEQIEQLNAAFMAEYPHITIDRVSQSFEDLATTLRLAITDNDAPDVVQANNGRNTMGAFVAAGQLLPLNDYADEHGWFDRFPASILTYSTYSEDAVTFGQGNLYGLPQVGEVVGIFYSKAKLAELGLEVPTTWAEFETALETAKAAGEIPMQLGNIEGWPAMHVFGPLQGGSIEAAEVIDLGLGNPGRTWITPEQEAVAAHLADWVTKGYFNDGVNGTDYDAAWQALAQGDGVFLPGGSWLAADLGDAMGDDVGFFIPESDFGGPATTGGTGLPFAITAASDAPDAAALYIDFITSEAAMEVIAETGNLPVIRTAELAPADGINHDVFTVFGQVTETGAILPYLDWATPTFYDTLSVGLQDLLAGETTPAAFLEALEADYAAFVGSAG